MIHYIYKAITVHYVLDLPVWGWFLAAITTTITVIVATLFLASIVMAMGTKSIWR